MLPSFCFPPLDKRLFGLFQRGSLTQIPVVKETRVESGQFLLLSVLCMLFILVALAVSASFFCVRQRSHLRMKEKLASLGTDTSTDATATYQVRAPTPPRPGPFSAVSQSGGRRLVSFCHRTSSTVSLDAIL